MEDLLRSIRGALTVCAGLKRCINVCRVHQGSRCLHEFSTPLGNDYVGGILCIVAGARMG